MGRVAVIVSPGADRTELVGRHGDAWKIRVAAPPARGRANEAVVTFLVSALGVARARVRIVAGATTRRKVVEVDGVESAEIGRRLSASAAG